MLKFGHLGESVLTLPKVILADDQPVVLAGLRSLVGGFCEVVAEARDGRTLIASALNLRPDLIILPIGMPKLNGLETARRIKARWPEARLLFFTMHADIVYLREALRTGARGYVLKTSSLDEMRIAIETVLTDGIYVCSVFGQDAVPNLHTATGKPARSSVRLSERQREILQLITEGQSNKEIATTLGISVKTVDFHRARMMQALRVHTAAELAVAAIRNGLLVTAEPIASSSEILEPKAQKALWSMRLNEAKLRLDRASHQLRDVREELRPAAASSDGQFAVRNAVIEERVASAEYRRLWKVYRDLTIPGEIPDPVEDGVTYPDRPNPEE